MIRQSPSTKALKRLSILVLALGLMPLSLLIVDASLDQLGANPIESISHRTGFWSLSFLLMGLSLTPLRLLSGASWLIRFRRMLGLFAFFYACLHFLNYLLLDQFFDWSAIAEDISKRPYLSVGFAAFLLLLPLALTSSDAMMRRLGGKRWRRLHRLVYLSTLGGVLHYLCLVKKDLSNPLWFAGLFALLLLLRWLPLSHRHRPR